MSERAHALLSASSADRWLHCPGSVLLTTDMPDEGSAYAEEGTQAHAVCEELARVALAERGYSIVSTRLGGTPAITSEEMLECARVYLDTILGVAKNLCDSPYIALEQRVDFSQWVPEGFGTADCVLVGGDTLYVVDYKHGKGVRVEVTDNPQLMLYALGALERYRRLFTVTKVQWTIVQPRNGGVSHSEPVSAEWLLHWAEETIAPAAQLALTPDAPCVAGDWCRWCKAKATCRARSEFYLSLERFHKDPPKLLSEEEIGGILLRAQELSAWAKDVEEEAMTRLLAGAAIPGWKAVEGRSVRNWTDPEAAFRRAMELGVPEAMLWERKPVTLAQLEKVMGKKNFATLEAYVTIPPGKPALALDSDKRPAITSRPSAEQDFA